MTNLISVFNVADLVQARSEFLQDAHVLPPGAERNQKLQIADSLKRLIEKTQERDSAFRLTTYH